MSQSSAVRVFICYSRKDIAFVNRLVADLRARGVPAWRDVDNIPRDVSSNTSGWRDAVDRGLRDSTHLVVVLSPDSVTSAEVGAEWNSFLRKGRPVIPVLYRDCDIPYRLEALNFWDMREDYEAGLAGLVDALPTARGSDAAQTMQGAAIREGRRTKAAKPAAKSRKPLLWIGAGALGVLICLAVGAALILSRFVSDDPPVTPRAEVTDAPVAEVEQAIQGAVIAFDAQMRIALETGNGSGLSNVAAGAALEDRLAALRILRDAGNCYWNYDHRGITFNHIEVDGTLALVEASVDRDGHVECGGEVNDDYTFFGPVNSEYLVELLSGRWIVTDYDFAD